MVPPDESEGEGRVRVFIVFGKRTSARRWFGLALWAAVPVAGFAGARGQSVKRTVAASHVAPVKGAAAAVISPGAAEALLEMSAAASVVFAGRVEAVARNDGAGFVDVRFRIEQALRGCPESGVYVLREWAGLWIGHPERYRGGERLLMLLPARGPSGMSAPAGGMDGAIPIVATGVEPLADGTGVAAADDGSRGDAAASEGVDLRWVAARAARSTVAATGPLRAVVGGGAIGRPVLPAAGDGVEDGWSGPVAPLNAGPGPAATMPASLSSVLALLRGTRGANNGAR